MDTMAVLLGAQLVTLLSPVPWSSTFPFLQIGSSQWKDMWTKVEALGVALGMEANMVLMFIFTERLCLELYRC